MAATPQRQPGIHKLETANPDRVRGQRGTRIDVKDRPRRKSRRK